MGTNDSTSTKQQQDTTRVGGADDSRTVNTNDSSVTRPDDSMKRKESPQEESDNPTRNS
jgi:hypothetical protein